MVFRSIRSRITFLSSLSLLIIGTTIITLATLYVRNSALQRASDQIRFIAQDRATHVQYELDKAMESLNLLAIILRKVKDPIESINLEREQVNSLLHAILKQNKNIVGTYTCWLPNAFDGKDKYYENEPGHDKTGRFAPHWYRNKYGIIDVESCRHVHQEGIDDYLLDRKKIKQSLVTDPHIHKIGGKDQRIISVLMPIALKERHYGIVGADLKVEVLQHLTEEIGIKEKGGRITILTADGKIIDTTGRQNPAGEDASKIVENMDQYVKEIAYGKEFNRALKGEIMFFAPIKTTNLKPWWVIVSVAKVKVTAEARTLSKLLIFVGVGCIILSILFFWLFSNSMVKPLNLLLRSVKQVGRGNYGQVVEDVSSSDEIGELATAFNNMSIEIKKKDLERDGAEEALRESEGLLDASQQLTKVGGWEWNIEKQTIFWTKEVYRIHDFEPSEFPQGSTEHIERSLECYDIEDRSVIMAAFRRCAEKGQAYDLEFPFTTAMGRRIWIRTVAEPVLDGNRVIKVVGNIMDITKRKQAEEALKGSEEHLQSVFRAAPTGIGVVIDRVLKQVNKRMCEMVGYSEEELIGRNARVLYPSDEDYEYVGREKYEQIRDHGTGTVETRFKRKDGRIIDVLLSSTPLDLNDLSKGVTFTALDITAKKRTEESLQESEEKYRSMMESMKELVNIISSDCRIEYMNPSMIKRTGRDATGEICFKVLHDLDEKCSWCRLHKIQKGDHFATDIVSPKDSRSYHVAHSPLFHKDGSISKMTIYRDTTDFKKMETQLQQAQKMEAIGTLAGGIAHDFNNILFPISGYTEMLLADTPADSPFHQSLSEILSGTKRAGDLVKQILTFSRQREHELKPLKVEVVVKEALKLIRSSLPTTIKIQQNVDKDCGLVMADPTQIHQIVMNLCTNAFHAMEKTGGKLIITLKEVELAAEDLKDLAVIPGPHVRPGGGRYRPWYGAEHSRPNI